MRGRIRLGRGLPCLASLFGLGLLTKQKGMRNEKTTPKDRPPSLSRVVLGGKGFKSLSANQIRFLKPEKFHKKFWGGFDG